MESVTFRNCGFHSKVDTGFVDGVDFSSRSDAADAMAYGFIGAGRQVGRPKKDAVTPRWMFLVLALNAAAWIAILAKVFM